MTVCLSKIGDRKSQKFPPIVKLAENMQQNFNGSNRLGIMKIKFQLKVVLAIYG